MGGDRDVGVQGARVDGLLGAGSVGSQGAAQSGCDIGQDDARRVGARDVVGLLVTVERRNRLA